MYVCVTSRGTQYMSACVTSRGTQCMSACVTSRGTQYMSDVCHIVRCMTWQCSSMFGCQVMVPSVNINLSANKILCDI